MTGFWPRLARLLLVAAALGIAVAGTVPPARAADPSPAAAGPWYHQSPDGEPVVDLWFGWSSTCPHCTRARAWLESFSPGAPWLEVHSLQVDGEDSETNVDTLLALAAGIGEEIRAVPVFLFAGRLQTGFDEAATTGRALERDLAAYRDGLVPPGPPTPGPPAAAPAAPASEPPAGGPPGAADGAGGEAAVTLPLVGTIDARSVSLPLLAVILGGLDAVNPCALSVLLFLVSALVGAGSRRQILAVGGAFVVVTAVVYFLLMAAWLHAFLLFGELRVVTAIAGALAIAAGLINVKDFGWFGRGPSLVIPRAARPGIFERILDLSQAVSLPALLVATVMVAATVAAYEMLCTGGFPVVFTRVLTLADLPLAAYYGYLVLYVTVYVLPLLAIVAAFGITMGTRRVSIDEARRLKLLSGLLMLGVGALLLFAPDRLSDLTWTLGLFLAAGALWLALLTAERASRARRPA